MKQVAILTFHRAVNYGAVLQCWALQTVCEALGFEVKVINYNPWGIPKFKHFLNKRNPITALRGAQKFYLINRFLNTYIKTTSLIPNREELMQNTPEAEFYIVGSDTVWDPAIVGPFMGTYMFDFLPSNAVKISYAASMGGTFAGKSEDFLEQIKSFKAISLREPDFVEETKKISTVDVVDVCDPTLLLSKQDYSLLETRENLPSHYIAVFDLNNDPLVKDVALKLASTKKLPIISIGKKYPWSDKSFSALSPNSWLYIIKNATYVCSNSFHGICFSLIYNVPFVACGATSGNRKVANVRIKNLLKKVNALSRYIESIEDFASIGTIDFDDINTHLISYKKSSLLFLKNALNYGKE